MISGKELRSKIEKGQQVSTNDLAVLLLTMMDNMNDINIKLGNLGAELVQRDKEIKDLKRQINYNECNNSRYNVILKGIPMNEDAVKEKRTETCLETRAAVEDILTSIQVKGKIGGWYEATRFRPNASNKKAHPNIVMKCWSMEAKSLLHESLIKKKNGNKNRNVQNLVGVVCDEIPRFLR